MSQHRAIVINNFWAGILGTLFTTCIVGGITFAWNSNAQQAVTQSKVEILEQANLPSRLDRLEEKVNSTNETLNEFRQQNKEQQAKMEQKIDLILREAVMNRSGNAQ